MMLALVILLVWIVAMPEAWRIMTQVNPMTAPSTNASVFFFTLVVGTYWVWNKALGGRLHRLTKRLWSDYWGGCGR